MKKAKLVSALIAFAIAFPLVGVSSDASACCGFLRPACCYKACYNPCTSYYGNGACCHFYGHRSCCCNNSCYGYLAGSWVDTSEYYLPQCSHYKHRYHHGYYRHHHHHRYYY